MAARRPYNVRLSDTERAKLQALARELGREPAVLLRDIIVTLTQVRPADLVAADSLTADGVLTLRSELGRAGEQR